MTVRSLEEAQLEKLARAILGVGAEQAKAELASGEIADTPAGEAFAIVLAQREALKKIDSDNGGAHFRQGKLVGVEIEDGPGHAFACPGCIARAALAGRES